MVLVTFEEAINEGNVHLYESVFKEYNPNGCPPRGTFFVREKATDFGIVRDLFDKGHECGVGSFNGSVPKGQEAWKNSVKVKFYLFFYFILFYFIYLFIHLFIHSFIQLRGRASAHSTMGC